MHLVIQDWDTGLFRTRIGWTVNPNIAQHFEDKKKAKKVVLKLKIKNAHLVTLNEIGRVVEATPIRISN